MAFLGLRKDCERKVCVRTKGSTRACERVRAEKVTMFPMEKLISQTHYILSTKHRYLFCQFF